MNRTDTRRIPVIDGELADTTRAMEFPWLRPPVRTVHVTPRQAWSRRWRRFRSSPFVADVATGLRRGMAVLGVLAIAWAVFEIGRAFYLAASSLGELLAAFGWLIP